MNEPTEAILSAILNLHQYKIKLYDLQHHDSLTNVNAQDVVYLFKSSNSDHKPFSFKYILEKEQAQLVNWDYISNKIGYEVWAIIF